MTLQKGDTMKMKLKEAVELFLDQYENDNTRRAYAQSLEPMRDYLGPDYTVERIKPTDCADYWGCLIENDYSKATLRKHGKNIRTFFNWLIRLDEIQINPARAFRLPNLPRYHTREKAMKETEFERILDYAKWDPRYHALVLFLGDTGCRAGGISGLHWSDIDIDQGRAIVTEKGDHSRPVWFGDDCQNALRKWQLEQQRTNGDYVFSYRGGVISADSISQIIRRICLKVGTRSLGAHSMRHRKGHQLADDRVNPSIAATALGHKSVLTYLHNYAPADYESAEKAIRELTHGVNTSDDETSESKIIDLEKYRRRVK